METPSLDAIVSTASQRLSSAEVKPMAEEHLRELARDFAAHGPAYANRYVEYLVGERSTVPLPGRVHPKIAAAIRDVVTDSALVAGVKTVRVVK